MYLVHLALVPHDEALLPAQTGKILRATAPDVVEHVSVHSDARPHPVIGLFLRSSSLHEAETAAKRIWENAVADCPGLSAWRLRRAEVPLLPLLLE